MDALMNVLEQLANSMDFYVVNLTGKLTKIQWKNIYKTSTKLKTK